MHTPSHIRARRTMRRSGFTLIELIVVIAIIGLLASIVMAAVVRSRAQAEIARVLTEYKSTASALELYRQASGDYPGRDVEGQSMNMNNLIPYLSAYLKQVPSMSPAVVEGSVYYYLNPKDGSNKYLCGTGSGHTQDYVIYFEPTADALDSRLFKTLYDGSGNPVGDLACVSVNQD